MVLLSDYVRVVGRFFTHQKTDGVPVPLVGRVFFTPVSSAYSTDTVYGAVERTGYVIDGVLCEDKAGESPGLSLLAPGEGVQPSAWSYRVVFSLTDEDGDRACLQPFYLEAKAGDEIDLATVSPVPDPVTGEWMLRGEKGEKGDPGEGAFQLIPDPEHAGLGIVIGKGSLAPTSVPGVWKIGEKVG